jgi:dihydrofolate reductase
MIMDDRQPAPSASRGTTTDDARTTERRSYLERAMCCVFAGVSLDGCIARADGSIDWLDAMNAGVPPGEDLGFGEFMQSIDVIVMGRVTFETVLRFDEWPYGAKPIVVLSRTWNRLSDAAPITVSLSDETPRALVERLSAQGVRRIYVDGGATIRSFLADGLIDEMTITTLPILIGEGRRLFGATQSDVHFEHVSTHVRCGFVQTTWRRSS